MNVPSDVVFHGDIGMMLTAWREGGKAMLVGLSLSLVDDPLHDLFSIRWCGPCVSRITQVFTQHASSFFFLLSRYLTPQFVAVVASLFLGLDSSHSPLNFDLFVGSFFLFECYLLISLVTMKVELTLQHLDQWMLRWRKFQTESDWQIERNRQWWRQADMTMAAGVMGSLVLYTSGSATIRRQFGAPHFFDVGVDSKIKETICETLTSRWRYTPQGYGRLVVVGLPTYLVFAISEHIQERRRLRKYAQQNTVFGEQARRLVENGKIEEYLAVDIKASLPQNQKQLYA